MPKNIFNIDSEFLGTITATSIANATGDVLTLDAFNVLKKRTPLEILGDSGITSSVAELNLLDLSGLTAGWVLSADSATTASWKAPSGGGVVTSVFTRTGAIVATAGDYDSFYYTETESDAKYLLNTTDTLTGTLTVTSQLLMTAATTESSVIKMGSGRGGNGHSYIDLIGDVTYPTYGLRLLRGETGANTYSDLIHRGTGDFNITASEAGKIVFKTTNVEQMSLSAIGLLTVGNQGITSTGDITGTNIIGTTSAEAAIIRATGTGDAGLATTLHAFQVGLTTGNNIRIDDNEIMAISNGVASTLRVNRDGGAVTIGELVAATLTVGSTVTATNFILSSDKRLKENILPYQTKPINIDWRTFDWKERAKGDNQIGVIAQELEKEHPEFITTDHKGFKSVKYTELLIAKIVELESRIKQLEK
jgi:hypothetical protein